ncbi:hypothetical protein F4803DRAFT_543032 [Xylaria telfairii]|nr:hypothetical protein F4803DRAFT_543032 [Xylaria telfairii]
MDMGFPHSDYLLLFILLCAALWTGISLDVLWILPVCIAACLSESVFGYVYARLPDTRLPCGPL